jgi:hypothetical protein
LPWLQVATSFKAFGVVFTPKHRGTVAASWDHFIGGIERVLHIWQAKFLPTLMQKVQALEVYALSKA